MTGQQLTLKDSLFLQADRFIGYDGYQHLYYINEGVLHKDGDLGKFVFKDYQLGPISSVDIINPLNVVVFYAEVNTVVFLDNRLNEKERINFNELDSFINCGGATNAGNNRLWLFNIDTQQLQLYDYRNKRETIVSQPINGILRSQVSNFNDCFVLTENSLSQINIYGGLLFETEISEFERVVRSGKMVMLAKENELFSISEESIVPIDVAFNEKPIKDLQLTQEFLYIYNGNMVFTYSLTQPKQ
ncbi:MAG: hypothetical protein HKN48_10000 [Flavobacteriaceae bacterium]|nr:hypothetical protein [Flavobacteriaceae bacterium]